MDFKPKIILFDLETLPNLKEALKVWPQLSNYPSLTLRATVSTVICAGYKVLGEKKTHCINAWDFPNWKNDVNDDSLLISKIYKVLKEADAVVTHNGKRFDWKFLQTRLLFHKMPPLQKTHHIDTKELAKRNMFSFNNKLGYLGEWLVNDKKLENGGWQLWIDVYNNKRKAKKLMTEYCIKDVMLLEKVFNKLKPFAKNIPNYNLWLNNSKPGSPERICPNCGSKRLRSRGWTTTKTRAYRRLRCLDCFSYCRTDYRDNNPRSI